MSGARAFVIRGDAAALARIQAAAVAALAEAGAGPRSQARAGLLIEEVALNALRHGGAPEVRLTVAFEDGRARLVFEDAGAPFDPTADRAPPPPGQGPRIGGLGLPLLRGTAAQARYARDPAGLNRLDVLLRGEEEATG
jgi:anti-sigma regulatory factor (Ser/Thr protein kinase)